MELIKEVMGSLEIGEAVTFKGLTMFPLTGESRIPGYLLLDEALSLGCARVTEVSEAGDVNQLKFINEGKEPVLLLDGEELIGAKQNRILNISILVAGETEIVIPVSCVEAGRWGYGRGEFRSSEQVLYCRARAAKSSDVSDNLRHRRSRQANQRNVWNDISGKMGNMNAQSSTESMSDIFDSYSKHLDEYEAAFPVNENQVGGLYSIGGKIAGVEYFDSRETYSGLHGKLIRSYAIDAMEMGQAVDQPKEEDPGEFLKNVVGCGVESFKAIGLGDDVRLDGRGVRGGALAYDERLIHLCAFRQGRNGSGGRKMDRTEYVVGAIRRQWGQRH
jgi:hypothetical protein